MKPPELVKLAGRPKIRRTREKDEAVKRQGEWGVSRKGRVMTYNNCGETKHNARGCDKPPNKEKRQKIIDEDEEVGKHPQVEINLTAPQRNQASQGPEFVFMPTPSVYRETSSCAFF